MANTGLRSVARWLGLGSLGPRRIGATVRASQFWTEVPPRRIKDMDSGGLVPPNSIALTFDDGPDPEVTPRLLRVLESHEAHATFFMCGLAAQRYPDVVRAVADAGHTIGGHTWDHRPIRGLTQSEWKHQIDDTHELLAGLTAAPIRWFRPPWGLVDGATRERLRQRGVTTVLWSATGADWSQRDPQRIADAVVRRLERSAIVLLHDAVGDFLSPIEQRRPDEPGDRKATVAATDMILRAALERTFDPVSFDVLPAGSIPRIARPRLAGIRRRTVTDSFS